MPIQIKNPAVRRLADELAFLTGESPTETIRKALEEKMVRLSTRSILRARSAELARTLGSEFCSSMPAAGASNVLTPAEVQELLAYGP
jgi:hypothetical protein